jgi:hypothetical protein
MPNLPALVFNWNPLVRISKHRVGVFQVRNRIVREC